MKIVFTREAKRDLDELRAYLQPLSPQGLANITAAIEARIRSIAQTPNIGRRTPRDDVLEAVETKYGFLIPYMARAEALFILRVYRSSRSPLDYDVL